MTQERLQTFQYDCRRIAAELMPRFLLERGVINRDDVASLCRSSLTPGHVSRTGRTRFSSHYGWLRETRLPFTDEIRINYNAMAETPLGLTPSVGGIFREGCLRLEQRNNLLRRTNSLCDEYVRGLEHFEDYFESSGRRSFHAGLGACPHPDADRLVQVQEVLWDLTGRELTPEQLETNILDVHRTIEQGPLMSGDPECNLQRSLENMQARRSLDLPPEI